MMNLNKKKLSLLSKIDNLYIEKAKGAYVRSEARWIEKGEKSNSSFFRFEKKATGTQILYIFFVNGIINNWPTIISSKIFTFYRRPTLYS